MCTTKHFEPRNVAFEILAYDMVWGSQDSEHRHSILPPHLWQAAYLWQTAPPPLDRNNILCFTSELLTFHFPPPLPLIDSSISQMRPNLS